MPGCFHGRGSPDVFGHAAPANEDQTSGWRERLRDIHEGTNRFGEEHYSKARECEIEDRLEIVMRRVALDKYYPRILRHGACSGDIQHRAGDINARGCAIPACLEGQEKG